MARSERNKRLYSEVYNSDSYTEIAELENTNEVDLSKIKELLKSREEYQKAKNYKEILGPKEEPMLDVMVDVEEERVYDVNSIMARAKDARRETESYKRSTTEYDILKKLNLLSIEEKAKDMLQTNKREEDKLRELIDTITLKKEEILDTDQGAALDFLDDLRGETMVLKGNSTRMKGDTTVIDDELLMRETLVGEMIVASPQKTVTKKFEKIPESKVDSFFTTSLNLNKNDFDDFDDFSKSGASTVVLKILLFIVTAIVLVIGFFVYNTYINV